MSHVQSEKEVCMQLQANVMLMTSRLLQRKLVEKQTRSKSSVVTVYKWGLHTLSKN